MSPLVTYKGWTVSKQSANKIAATELTFVAFIETFKKNSLLKPTMPTHVALESDSDINDDAVLAGFPEQTKEGTPAPTTRAMSLVYDPLSTAFEQAYSGIASTDEALSGASQP